MRLNDLTVEVRDANLTRLGQVPPDLLRARLEPGYCSPGAWSLTLPSEHPMAAALERPGAGIIVTHSDPNIGVLLSGPSDQPNRQASVADPRGTSTFTGTSDTSILWKRRAYPSPNAPADAQTAAYDVVTNVAGEYALRYYTRWNIGDYALPERQAVILEPNNLYRGGLVTKSARFDVLGDLLASIAQVAGLGFRVVQVGDVLQFQVTEVRDRRKRVRLDLANGTLASQSVKRQAPTLTTAIVAGQGEGVDRTILEVSSTDPDVALYGPHSRVEGFKDQRNTDDPDELLQAALEALAEGGPALAVTAVPGDDSTMAYPLDWNLGDRITVVVDAQETEAQVTGAIILLDQGGVRVGASIGDVKGWDPQATLRRQQNDTTKRVDALERAAAEQADPSASVPRVRRIEAVALSGVGTSGVRAIPDTTIGNPFPDLPVVVTWVCNANLTASANDGKPSVIGVIADSGGTTVARYEDLDTSPLAGAVSRQVVVTAAFPAGTASFMVYMTALNRNGNGTVSSSASPNTDYGVVRVEPAVQF